MLRTKVIGRQPTDHGAYNPSTSYGKKFQVQLYGCVWESLHDNNNTAPAVWDGGDVITENPVDWKKVSGSTDAWLESLDKPATTGTTGGYPYNGMGRVVLKKNMVGGAPTLTQDMFYKGEAGLREPNTNTVFVIQYDFTLDEDITVPDNCVLEFDGGSISGEHTLIGNNTGIEAGLVKIFGTNITLEGTWNAEEVYPEWFGAKGDGVTDDTVAIRNACSLNGTSKLVFSPKTYIFNVAAGTDYTTPRTAIGRIYQGFVEGNNACLKLGNNNNCDIRAYKGFGKVFYVQGFNYFKVQNLTIDFNYSQNPIYQISGRSQFVEENTQQNAFQVIAVHNFIVENCTFIGHSGTNCIDYYMNDSWANNDVYVKIDNCRFLKCGGVSYYDNNGVIETAAHDVSTCALHYRSTNAQHKYRLDFTNNYMEGVGINAYNALECSPHYLNYSGNKVIGFASAVMPCSYGNDYACAYIVNNVFLKAKRPIRLWMTGYNEEVDATPAFNELVIENNNAEIDIVYHDTIKDYAYITSTHGSLFYGLVDTKSGVSRNFGGEVIINNNIIKYVNIEEAKTLFSGTEFQSATFDMYKSCVNGLTESKVELLQVSNNYVYNAPALILRVSTFSKIIKLIFEHNIVINPYTLIFGSGTAGAITYFYLSSNTDVSVYGIGDVYIKNNFIDNTLVNYDEGAYAIISFNLGTTPAVKEDRVKVITGNRTTRRIPLTNLFGGTFVQQITNNKNIDDQSLNHALVPTNLTAEDFGALIFDMSPDWTNLMIWLGNKYVNGLGQTSALRMGRKVHRDDIAANVLSSTDMGFLFFDKVLNKPFFYDGSKFVNSDGLPADITRHGTKAQRPSGEELYGHEGFQYLQIDDLNGTFPIWASEITRTGEGTEISPYEYTVNWVDATGATV